MTGFWQHGFWAAGFWATDFWQESTAPAGPLREVVRLHSPICTTVQVPAPLA